MLKKWKMLIVTSLLAVGAVAGIAAAQGGERGGNGKAGMMQKFDANGDGKLDDAEKAKMKEAFAQKRAERQAAVLAKYDANKDGKLDSAERQVMKDERAAERFKKLDTNGDGKLSLDEFKAGAGFRGGHHRGGHRGGGKHA